MALDCYVSPQAHDQEKRIHLHRCRRCWVQKCTNSTFLSVVGCSVLFVTVWQVLPVGLAEIPPGPELAGVLAGIELSRLSGYDCVEALKAALLMLLWVAVDVTPGNCSWSSGEWWAEAAAGEVGHGDE